MVVVRKANASDVPVILQLIRALAAYEREPNAVVATEEGLLRDGFGSGEPAFHVHLAEIDGDVVGFALWFYTYSTWLGRRCLYLEDLFVKPEMRGKGAGIALMRELARAAVDAGCKRFEWEVLDWNQPSIDFYEKIGARVERQWLSVRLAGEALERLASRA